MEREHLPAAIKREIRQRCGFGCVMCGSPVFDYEHIDGYGVTGHDPAAMTLLCPAHHREKTAGRLPAFVVRRANTHPRNSFHKLTQAHGVYFEGSSVEVEMGSVSFAATDLDSQVSIVDIDNEPIIGATFIDGRISLRITVRDEDNRPVLVVRDGELRLASHSWDVTFIGKTLTIRRGPNDVALAMKLLPPNRIVVERAKLWGHGVLMLVGTATSRGGIEVANNGVGSIVNCRVLAPRMLAIGEPRHIRGAGISVPVRRRWFGGVPVGPGSFSLFGGGQIDPFINQPGRQRVPLDLLAMDFFDS